MCFVGLFPLIKFPQTYSRTRADAKAKLSCIASRRANISWAIRSSSLSLYLRIQGWQVCFSCDWDNVLENQDTASKNVFYMIHYEVGPWKQMIHIKKKKWNFVYKTNGELSTSFPQFDYRPLVFAKWKKNCFTTSMFLPDSGQTFTDISK